MNVNATLKVPYDLLLFEGPPSSVLDIEGCLDKVLREEIVTISEDDYAGFEESDTDSMEHANEEDDEDVEPNTVLKFQ